MIDTDKYEGHTPAPWEPKDVGFSAGESPWNDLDLSLEENQNLSGLPTEWVVIKGGFMSEADAKLIADAPLFLEEVKDLQKKLDSLREYCHAEGYDIFNWEVKNIEVIE